MSSQDFHSFPKLPSEIRDLIWIAATTPRIVDVWSNDTPHRNRFTGHYPPYLAPPKWLQSSSPIPTPLHTCRESRQALQRYGYQLAFGVDNGGHTSEPRTWFNFNCDALYLDLEALQNPCNQHLRSTAPKHHIQYCSKSEQTRVKNLALFSNTTWKSLFDVLDHKHPIDNFENVEYLMLVEHHNGHSTAFFDLEQEVRPGSGKALLFLDHDAAEGISWHLDPEFADYLPWYTRLDGYRGFKRTRKVPTNIFRDLESEFEMKLRVQREAWACRAGGVLNATRPQPKVCLGAIFTESQAEKVIRVREAYWNGVMEMEAIEAEIGARELMFKSLGGTTVPFTEDPSVTWETHLDNEEEEDREILERHYEEEAERVAVMEMEMEMEMEMQAEGMAAVEAEYGPPSGSWTSPLHGSVSSIYDSDVLGESLIDTEEEDMFNLSLEGSRI